jgi:hypothetical protein
MAGPVRINVNVIHTTNKVYNFVVDPVTTVGALKALLGERAGEDPADFRFLSKGRMLDNDDLTLAHYNITNCSTIYNMGKLPGGAGILPIGSSRTTVPPPTTGPKPKKPGL